jgi:NADPH:quinone reductase-like Zn-dependent oxidoreductase
LVNGSNTGTGRVTSFAVQFARLWVQEQLPTTTSTTEKTDLLNRLGPNQVINYCANRSWGLTAKQLTGGSGVDFVVQVTGTTSLTQSAKSVKLDGIISDAGLPAAPSPKNPSYLDGCLDTALHCSWFVER